MPRYLLIAATAIIALATLTALGLWRVKANLAARYLALQSNQTRGATLIEVDHAVYEDWLAAINSHERKTILTSRDAFSGSFPALADAGFSPDIDGYLALLTSDLPDPDSLSTLQLVRWHNAAALRMVIGRPNPGAPLYVHRVGGVVLGFSLPSSSKVDRIHLGILRGGSYAEYVSVPKPAAKQDDSEQSGEREPPVTRVLKS